MYELSNTIIAVSSPTSGQRVIVRISGPNTINILQRIFSPYLEKGLTAENVETAEKKLKLKNSALSASSAGREFKIAERKAGLIQGRVEVDCELAVGAKLYLFLAGHSYTGEDLAEIHMRTSPSVTEALMGRLLGQGLRMAGPGEFTARAYLNGKIDLAQAEAVNEIITGSNKLQLAAAERLLSGQLAETTARIRTDLMDCLSLIEAGLDFSGEDIELGPHFANPVRDPTGKVSNGANSSQNETQFITGAETVEEISRIKKGLEQLLSDSIRCESVLDMPAVAIAGTPNAGKSSLLNKLLGEERSIVSEERKTTRDILTGVLTLNHCKCVLFDCAGLTPHQLFASGRGMPTPNSQCPYSGSIGAGPNNILDELTQRAAIEAIQNSSAVLFCVDVSKADWVEDAAICELLNKFEISPAVIAVATKSDLLGKDELTGCLRRLEGAFDIEFVTTSSKTGAGMELLREKIDGKLIEQSMATASTAWGWQSSKSGATIPKLLGFEAATHESLQGAAVLTARHKQAVTDAIENISESIIELKAGNDEVAAMLLRAGYQSISNIEGEHVEEQILERIFSRFCIGK